LNFSGNLLKLRRESMSDFGERLRQARDRRGISLRQMAASTKIPITALEALERNDVSKLPGGIFSRAFVRSYAVEVGLDPDVTVREFLERFHAQSPPSPEPHPQHVPVQETQFESQQRIASVLFKLVAISVPLIVTILYFTLRTRPPAAMEAQASDGPAPSAQVADSAAASPPQASDAAPAPSPPPAAAVPQSGGTSGALPAVGSGPMRLEVHPTGRCWVSLTVDGKRVFARMMQAGQRETTVVTNAAIIEVGDAGKFAFSIDGREGRPIGSAGQIKTLKVTRTSAATLLR
jgi:cytoskeleton protein RodZ